MVLFNCDAYRVWNFLPCLAVRVPFDGRHISRRLHPVGRGKEFRGGQMNKAPAFQFFPRDWKDKRVQRMDYFSRGVYIELLGHMWSDSKDQCSIEKDERALIGLLSLSETDFKKAWAQIQWPGDPILSSKGDRWISKRLQRVKREQLRYRRGQVKAGKKGAEKRWGRYGDPTEKEIGSPSFRQGSAIDPPLAENSSTTTPTTTPTDIVVNKGRGGGAVGVLWKELDPLIQPGVEDKSPDGIKALDILKRLGVLKGSKDSRWKTCLRFPLGRIKEVARMCKGKNVKTPAGFAIDALEKDWS